MKNYLIIYTQTASKQLDYNISPKDYNNWSRMISVSWALNYQLESKIIRPIGFTIDFETSKHIKISNEIAINQGEELIKVLKELIDILKNVDYIVSHNIEYHLNVLKSEFYRYNLDDKTLNLPTICLMKSAEKLNELILTSKYPTLLELYESIFKTNLNYKHSEKSDFELIKDRNINVLKKCFDFMFEENAFSNDNIVPSPNFFVIPHEIEYEVIYKIKFVNEIIFYENSILFQNVKSYKEFSTYGLAIVELLNKNNQSEYILLDYRGVVVCKSHKNIKIESDYDFDYLGISSNNHTLFYITRKPFYILLHKYEFISYIDKNIILKNHNNQKTLIKENGFAAFINANIIYNNDANYFVVIENNIGKIYDYNFKLINQINLYGYNIVEIDENNFLYYKDGNLLGILDIYGNLSMKPTFKYLEAINKNLVIFSNEYQELGETHNGVNMIRLGKKGITNYHGEILAKEIYDEIEIIDNELVGTLNNKKIKIKHE